MKDSIQLKLLTALVAAIVFAVDWLLPLGVAAGVPYVAAVLVALKSPQARFTLLVAAACSVLVLVGIFVSPNRGSTELWKVLTNRGLALFVIWVTAIISLQYKQIVEREVETAARHSRQMHAVTEAALAVNAAQSFADLMQIVAEQARSIIGAHWAVARFLAGDDAARAVGAFSWSEKYANAGQHCPDVSGIEAAVCQSNQPLRATQAEFQSDPQWSSLRSASDQHPTTRGWLAVPLVARDGKNLGLIQLADKGAGEFTAEDLSLLVQFSRLASVELQLHQENEELAARIQQRTAELEMANQGLQREITERKLAEQSLRESEQRLQSVLDNSSAVIYLKDLKGRYQLVNCCFESVFGIRREQLYGQTDYDVFPKATADVFRANDELVIQSGEIIQCEEVTTHGDAPHTYVSIKFPLRDIHNQVYAVAGISTDITDRKRDEENIRQYAAELERSNSQLQQFAHIAAHDLREPLRRVGSFCGLLKRHYHKQFGEEADKWIDSAVDGVRQLQEILKDLLIYSQVDNPGIRFEPTDCGLVYQQVLETLRPAIDQSRATVTCDPLPIIVASRLQLAQLFENLIGNAIKFRGERPPVVHVSAERSAEQCIFSVRDNGIGIKTEFHERIFDICKRLNLHDEYPGTGMGLAICRRIVHRHCGQIWVESEPSKGSTFYFTIANRLLQPQG
jgi:PAS domain S-box-containing protein